MKYDVIVVGAGAAGLSAAKVLSHAGKRVLILESRLRIGGRIHTLKGEGFSEPVEEGAEFIHGSLPLTGDLLKKLSIAAVPGEGKSWNIDNNQLFPGDLFDDGWDILKDKLSSLSSDMTIGAFLDKHLNVPALDSLKQSVIRFVEGYDAANIYKASAFALRDEWNEENIEGFRPVGGYSQLLDYMLGDFQIAGGTLSLSEIVKRIVWRRGKVEIFTNNGSSWECEKVIVTVPVPILKARMIEFDPPLNHYSNALTDVEMGSVIKFLFEFKSPFWEEGKFPDRKLSEMSFLFTDATVPTWWTQLPRTFPLLTGWLAGPSIDNLQRDDHTLMDDALRSLAYIFKCSVEDIQSMIKASRVVNWKNDPFAGGAYAYRTLDTNAALQTLLHPVEQTIFLAGEAYYQGSEMGTVEAALASGEEAARKALAS